MMFFRIIAVLGVIGWIINIYLYNYYPEALFPNKDFIVNITFVMTILYFINVFFDTFKLEKKDGTE